LALALGLRFFHLDQRKPLSTSNCFGGQLSETIPCAKWFSFNGTKCTYSKWFSYWYLMPRKPTTVYKITLFLKIYLAKERKIGCRESV
jgi:hypothetical protein